MKRVILNVAEKPSIAKHLMNALKDTKTFKKEESHSKYNPIFSFEGTFMKEPCLIKITSVTGHLKTFQFKKDYKNWLKNDPYALLSEAEIDFNLVPDKTPIFKNLEKLTKECTDLFLWLDYDREGEAIGFEIIDICKKVNPNMNIFRARFSSVFAKELSYAFQNPISPNPNLNNAVLVRQETDLRTGAAFTRFQTLALSDFFNSHKSPSISQEGKKYVFNKNLLSYGSCQFPTLSFIVNRYLENQKFLSTKFYKINLSIIKIGQTESLIWARNHLFSKEITEIIFNFIKEGGDHAIVRKVLKTEKIKSRPLPLNTIALQKLAVAVLKLSSDEVMSIAEKLYTSGYISYPRTETNIFVNFSNKYIMKNLSDMSEYQSYIEKSQFKNARMGTKNDEAHPPIYPIKSFDGYRNSREFLVYDLIARHFLAVFSENATLIENEVSFDCNGENFFLRGVQIETKGFIEIYEKFIYINEKKIGEFEEGERVKIKDCEIEEGKTTAPQFLTETDLIAMMDKNEIGTDSTIHIHIKKIQERNYAIKKNQFLIPTQIGIALLNAYKDLGLNLGEVSNRAMTEKQLNKIAKGEIDHIQVKNSILDEMKESYKKLEKNKEQYLQAFQKNFDLFSNLDYKKINNEECTTELFECNKCSQGKMKILKSKKNNYFIGCSNYPNCKNFNFFNNNNLFSKIIKNKESCSFCHKEKLECQTYDGKINYLCIDAKNTCPHSIQKFLTFPAEKIEESQKSEK